jgi:tetratricopeptide (TPR) repeat protein
MKRFAIFICLILSSFVLAEEQKGPVADAYREIDQKIPEANQLLAEGRWTEAVRLLNSVHPKDQRTVDQSQALASFMFQLHPEESYELHKEVAAAHPDKEMPNYLWAMEQHRRGEWKGALASYRLASRLMKDYAPTYGLAAECALRLGKVDEAMELWEKSEKAQTGTLEEFETEVCRIHGPLPKHRERETLMTKAKAGDVDAAVGVIALDLEWPEDWWNSGPNKNFLKVDLAAFSERQEPGRELELALLAAKLATEEFEPKKAKELLSDVGLLLRKPVLPVNGRVLSYLITFIHDHEFLSKDTLTKNWGALMCDQAKTSKDPELHNALAWLHLDTPELEAIDLHGWKQTGDARFAASYLGGQMQADKLTLDSPQLIQALKQFPDHYVVQSIPLGLTKPESPRYRSALIETIKADYMQLPRAGMIPRPSAKPLMQVFHELAEISKQ